MSSRLAQDLQTVGTQQMVAVFLRRSILVHLPYLRHLSGKILIILQIQEAIPDSHCSRKESPFPLLCVEFINMSVTVLFRGNTSFLLGIVLSTSHVLLQVLLFIVFVIIISSPVTLPFQSLLPTYSSINASFTIFFKKVPLILLLLLLEDFPTFYFIFIYFLATLCSMWNLSSLIRDRTHTPSSGGMES